MEIVGTVISGGSSVAILLHSCVLQGRSACRVRVRLAPREATTALGLRLDGDSALLVLRGRGRFGRLKPGTSVTVEPLDILSAHLASEEARTRLYSLLGDESPERLSLRDARHALLYILEARDPELRSERLSMLRAALQVAPPSRSELA